MLPKMKSDVESFIRATLFACFAACLFSAIYEQGLIPNAIYAKLKTDTLTIIAKFLFDWAPIFALIFTAIALPMSHLVFAVCFSWISFVILLPLSTILARRNVRNPGVTTWTNSLSRSWPLALFWWVQTCAMTYIGKTTGLGIAPENLWNVALPSIAPAMVFAVSFSLMHYLRELKLQRSSAKNAVFVPNLEPLGVDTPYPSQKPVEVVDLEPMIRFTEADRSLKSLIGGMVAWVPGMAIVIVAMLVLVLIWGWNSAGVGDILKPLAVFIPVAIAVMCVVAGTLGAVRTFAPKGYFVAIAGLLFVALCFLFAEPIRLSGILATNARQSQIRKDLLDLAIPMVALGIVVVVAGLHDVTKYCIFNSPARHPKRNMREFIRNTGDQLGISTLAALNPRLAISPIVLFVFASAFLSPLKLTVPGFLSTSNLAVFLSPLASAKMDLVAMNGKCAKNEKYFFDFPTIVSACAERGESSIYIAPQSTWGTTYFTVLSLFCITGFLGLLMGRHATTVASSRYQTTAPKDVRRPILYLRPFHLDRRGLKWRPRLLSGLLVPKLGEPRSIDEIVLNCCVSEGPVLAIGRPNEPTPPLGAARVYVEGDNWKQIVSGLAEVADHIVISVERTQGVLWEVEQTLLKGWTSKTLYLLGSHKLVNEKQDVARRIMREQLPEIPNGFHLVAVFESDSTWKLCVAKRDDRGSVEAAVSVFMDRPTYNIDSNNNLRQNALG